MAKTCGAGRNDQLRPVAVRKRYYVDNQEDAIVMFLDDIAAHLPVAGGGV